MPTVKVVNIGTIPPRTKFNIVDSIPIPTEDVEIDAANLTKEYECMDCAFKTQDVEKMLEHQSTDAYSIWHRFRRWWNS